MREGQFGPLDADLTRSAFTLPAKLVVYRITRHLPLIRPNSVIEQECLVKYIPIAIGIYMFLHMYIYSTCLSIERRTNFSSFCHAYQL